MGFCEELGIEHRLTSVTHPQANGKVEVTNKTLLHNLKTRVLRNKSNWVDEIPGALWAYRTTSRTPTGETPFVLAFGIKAVLPAEIGVPTPRIQAFDPASNEEQLRAELDLLEEKRDEATLRAAVYRQIVKRLYNAKVKEVTFQLGDLVLRENIFEGNKSRIGKLNPN
ncbi:hypothetical protein J5N97_028530 [Dioscorea zingiberensis]|uniref:Integrase catalytic domain-containing protein n=1 Tax=Dioscorea zingiberensis TaxID=325984 RepID=A0A9D5H4W9_9LILI|nr:hypothetical protein J5N97_028530 [Dioscorea zingiberensis]